MWGGGLGVGYEGEREMTVNRLKKGCVIWLVRSCLILSTDVVKVKLQLLVIAGALIEATAGSPIFDLIDI